MKLRPQVQEEKNKGSFKTRRLECIENLASEVRGMNYKGKEYLTVAVRHNHLLKYFPESRIEEEIVFQDDKKVICKTVLYIGETPYSTGHAEEKRDSSFINKTSALENAATSSLGRCLATFGLHGTEFASAEELVNALNNQSTNTQSTTKKVSIEDEIKKQTTETKLTALYSNWKKNNNSDDKIEKLFEQQQQSIKTNGGQNAKQW